MSSPSRTPNSPPRAAWAKDAPASPPTMTVSSDTPPSTPPYPGSSDAGSNASFRSNRSSVARSELMNRRRGFVRPQGTEFSTSAKSRESVMALGSIAHLQYFFAKTGLLDGKGGGLETKKQSESLRVDMHDSSRDSTYSSLRSSPELLLPHEQDFFLESPAEDIDAFCFDESIMLPPTTSTYNPQTVNLPPPPSADVLRARLREALRIAQRAWADYQPPADAEDGGELLPVPEGMHEMQGTELVELATSAIRAAKTYYYSTDISLLSSKDERTIRREFLAILDVLKRMAQRKFEGGIKPDEREALIKWVDGIERALLEEEKAIQDIRSRGRTWLEGSWEGREYDRYHLFLSYFDSLPDPLPPHTPITPETTLPTPFLAALQTGLRLIIIHNNVVRRSKRPFGQIINYHVEFSKPYRLADNLRYWKKAAEIRWEVRLGFDVAAVVNGTEEGWRAFHKDLGIWCEKVLQEVSRDWQMGEGAAAVGQVRNGRSPTVASTVTIASTEVEVGNSPQRRR